MMNQTQLEKYFYETRSPVYAVLFVVPLFLIYEILALTLHTFQVTHLRNGADVMMRNLAALFGMDNFPFIVLLILGALAVIAGYYRNKHQLKILPSYFVLMTVESILYSLMMGSIALNTTNFLLSVPHLFSLSLTLFDSNFWVNVMLSFGAGIHEEFFFRLVLIQALLFVGSFFFKAGNKNLILNWNSAIALFISSFIFAYFHYVGEYGDVFAWGSFTFRWVSGLYLAIIYLTRGFGVSAWTHAFYDLFLMTGMIE